MRLFTWDMVVKKKFSREFCLSDNCSWKRILANLLNEFRVNLKQIMLTAKVLDFVDTSYKGNCLSENKYWQRILAKLLSEFTENMKQTMPTSFITQNIGHDISCDVSDYSVQYIWYLMLLLKLDQGALGMLDPFGSYTRFRIQY